VRVGDVAGRQPRLVRADRAHLPREPREAEQDASDEARDAEYAHLVPLLEEYAAWVRPIPRETLRSELVTGYLPVAQHIARRFAHRGEPLDDPDPGGTVGLNQRGGPLRAGPGHRLLLLRGAYHQRDLSQQLAPVCETAGDVLRTGR